jgi:lipopolysaccharide/colanic/teichoic acid biosynthesis glycosyltransferase
LRITDDFGLLAAGCIGVVLPDTPAHGAWTVAADVREMLGTVADHFTCEVFEYPETEFPNEPRRRADDVLSSPDPPVRAMIELFCQRLPRWKRACDLLAAGAGLVLLSPVFLVIGIAVRISSPGPIFFRQERSGFGGTPFLMYKFRSMIDGADEIKEEFKHLNERDGPAFKIRNDPRVTSLGRVLRAAKLDELPQLWNVLKGDMSLVGPRPLPCGESNFCDRWHRRRLEVTPGITCFWQVSEHTDISFEEWARMDIRYALKSSPWQDVTLLLRTPVALLRGED